MGQPDILSILQDDSTNPCLYQYYHQLKENRTVVFNDEVNASILESVILPLQDFEKDDSTSPVTLIIHTPGGSPLDGLVLANVIDNYKKPLNIVAYGLVASMGAILMCAGRKNPNVKKYCYKFTVGLYHDGITAVEGESGSVEDVVAFNKRLDSMIKDYVVENTNFTLEEYESKVHRHQLYLTADELLEKGIVDEIL